MVPGHLIVTTAHVIKWDGGMALGDYFHEDVEIAGRRLTASVYAAEPVSDIAVLGAPDDQALPEARRLSRSTCVPSRQLRSAPPTSR